MEKMLKGFNVRNARNRAREKKDIVLEFLESEPYTTRENIAELLGLKWANKAHEFLCRLEKYGFVYHQRVPVLGGRQTLWYSCDRKLVVNQSREHVLGVQLMRIRAAAAGWTGWSRYAHGPGQVGDAWPDATTRDPLGNLVWIELERHLKADYRDTIERRIKVRGDQGWHRCLYISPTPALAVRVRKAIDALIDEPGFVIYDASLDQRSRINEVWNTYLEPSAKRTADALQRLHEWFPTCSYKNAFGNGTGNPNGNPNGYSAGNSNGNSDGNSNGNHSRELGNSR